MGLIAGISVGFSCVILPPLELFTSGHSEHAVTVEIELAVANRKSVKSYLELTNVTKVLCKFGTPEYDECAKANPVAWFDKEGKLLDQP